MTTKRKAISKKTRFEVFKRDGFKCQYCGAHPPNVLLHVDHIMAVANGGTNTIDNLVTACEPCNLGKGAVRLDLVPKSLADKAAEVAEREAQLLGYQEVLEGRRLRIEDEAWRVADELYGERCESVPRDHFLSIKRFIERLGYHGALESAEVAAARCNTSDRQRRFKYFCGVCWKVVKAGE